MKDTHIRARLVYKPSTSVVLAHTAEICRLSWRGKMLRGLFAILVLLLGGTWAHPGPNNKTVSGSGHIIGGVTVRIDDYPYQVSMRKDGNHLCGASIISNDWLLSAAHCSPTAPLATITFKVGSTSRTIGGTILTPVTRVIHPQYDAIPFDYDIAVYKMQQPIVYTDKIGPIGLATANPAAGTFVIVSGWGRTSADVTLDPPDILMAVSVPTVTTASCQSSYSSLTITSRMLCAGYTVGTKNACSGDSGGPLIVTVNKVKTQVGIVSWGSYPNCAAANLPGVYTSVANLRGWITTITGV